MPRRITGFLVGLLALSAFFVLYAFLVVYKYTIRPLLEGLAWFLDKIKIHAWKVHIDFGPWLAGKVRDVEHWVRNEIAKGALASEKTGVRFLHALTHLISSLGHLIGNLGHTLLAVLTYLRHHVIPRLIHAAVVLIRRLLMKLWRWARHAFHYAIHRIAVLWRWARHVFHYALRRLAMLWRWARHAVAFVWREIHSLWKIVRWLHRYLSWKHLRHVVAAILHRLGLAWLFGRNIAHMAEAVLGWSWHILRAFKRWITRLDDTLTLEGFVHASQETALQTIHAVKFLLHDYDETITTGEIPIPPVE